MTLLARSDSCNTHGKGKGTQGRHGKQLSLHANSVMHFWTRSMCSRTAEAPWTFHDYTQQPLRELIVRALLQIAELAGTLWWL